MVSLYTISIFHNCEKSIGNQGFEITKCTVGAAIGRPKGFGILSFTVKTERVPRPTLRAANGRPYGYKPTNSVYL